MGPCRPVEIRARLVDAPGHAHDVHGLLPQIARALGRGDDEGGRIVGLETAVEEMQRLHDPARVEHVVDGDPLLLKRLRVLGGVLAVGDAHVRDLRGRRAVLVHVAHERGREALPRAPHAEGHLGQVEPAHGLGGARPRAADADVRVAVHRAEERHRVAHPRLDGADGEADQRLGGGAAAHHVHVEVEPEAEIGRYPVGRAWSRRPGRTSSRPRRPCRGRRRPSPS